MSGPPDGTRMFQEAANASHAVREQLAHDALAVADIGAAVRRLAPRAVVTCARGSSDHAATYAKYLIETRARVLTASAAPSVSIAHANIAHKTTNAPANLTSGAERNQNRRPAAGASSVVAKRRVTR